jgi:hypothetical protein
VFLLAGTAVAILFGSVAVVNPNVRYLVPLAPLLLCGGALAARDLWTAFRPGATGVARPAPRQETAL